MEEAGKKIVLELFRKFYEKNKPTLKDIEKREFGVGSFRRKIESRHLSFTQESLWNYLVQDIPLFISYSAAYYEFPDATPMERKVWKGADLIFDLDVHGGLFLTPGEWQGVKDDAVRLIEDFLIPEFGIDRDETSLVFSGNRGYHIHVYSRDYLGLRGEERREIANYVSGNGLNYRDFFRKEGKKLRGPDQNDWGYKGRFYRMVKETIEKNPRSISTKYRKEKEKEIFLNNIKKGIWTTSLSRFIDRLEPIAEKIKLKTINTDAGVTMDTKRLIRLPGSLHGGTALVAGRIKNIDSFEPYRDAVAFGSSPIKIETIKQIPEIEFLNQTMEGIEKGKIKQVPLSYGIYLFLKGAAELR